VTVPDPRPTSESVRAGRGTPPLADETVSKAVAGITLPLTEVAIAVIVVWPVELASANPAELIGATSTSLDCHVTCVVRSCVIGLPEKVPTAMNWVGSPRTVTG
jgi:hypothetical protein